MQSRFIQYFFQNGVFFEPGPEHRKIINFIQLANMKTAPAYFHRSFFEIINDLGLAGCWSAVKNDNVKNIIHKNAP